MSALDKFNARLDAGEIIIMDGGTGTEIHRRGASFDPKTWTGSAMLDYPDLVREIHEDYLRAGADIITANSFSASPTFLKQGGLGHRIEEINKLAVQVAREAIVNAAPDREVLLVGSMATINPMGDPQDPVTYEAALEDYREQAGYLAEAGADVIAAEMIVRITDAKAAVTAATELGLPAWVGFSSVVRPEDEQMLGYHGRAGVDTLKEAVEAVEPLGVSMFHTMHSRPEDTAPAYIEIKEVTNLPVGAYSHTIKDRTANEEFDEGYTDRIIEQNPTTETFLGFAREWAALGAQVIGGCCGTTPDYIKALKVGLLPGSRRVTTVS